MNTRNFFPLDTIRSVSSESKKEQITIQRQRSEFDEALRVSGGNPMQPVSDSNIEMRWVTIIPTTTIHFFCQDARLIQASATGATTPHPPVQKQAQEDPIS